MIYSNRKIILNLKKYQFVSFDIFDTLIKRNVKEPNDIFELVENRYLNLTNEKIDNYKQERIAAELKAKAKVLNKEPNIDDIYNNINLKCDINTLKKIEIETEVEICQKNNYFYEIYEYCLKSKKTIILTTDMYLTEDILRRILSKNGIEGYNYLYVSNVHKKNKRTKMLFKQIISDLSISSKDLIHIGDSKKADFIAPRSIGIKSILIKRNYNNLKYQKFLEKSLSENVLLSYINNNYQLNKSNYYNLGFELLGPLLYGYCCWLKSELEKKNINKIYFFSREGNLLKTAFDCINNNQKIITKYLYVSRRSTRVPLLKNIKCLDDIFEIIKMRRIIDLESFFINVGLDIDNYKELIKKYDLNKYSIINNNKSFNLFFDEIIDDIINNSINEEKLILKYLKQENLNGVIAVADVGWMGTMQNSIEKILTDNGIDCKIEGFYLGRSPQYINLECNKNMSDYIFSNSKYDYSHIRPFLNLFESFFLAQHGTTLKYVEREDYIYPELADYEYNENETIIFREIQQGAMKFVANYHLNIIDESYLNGIFSFGLRPKMKHVKMFKNISYVETKDFLFVSNKGILYYAFNPKKAYIDFCNCSWKIGFLKRLFVIDMNYYKIYNLIDMISKKIKR